MEEKQLLEKIAHELQLNSVQVINTVLMLDEGNTVPFIARYRKEKTGSLDEEQIRKIQERIEYLRALEERRKTILKSIEEQGKLTADLKQKINSAEKLQELEDLYLPYKPKKRTRATIARERGLQPLADLNLLQETSIGNPYDFCTDYINSDAEINTAEEALAGAMDIVAEHISENAEIRKILREKMMTSAFIESSTKKDYSAADYEMYSEYSEPVSKIPPHRILAMNRGEKEKALSVGISIDSSKMTAEISEIVVKNEKSIFHEYLLKSVEDSFARLIFPSLEREVRNHLTEKADEHAINVFALNLRNLLLQPPVAGKIIMGIDPGFRTGCKVAVIDETGKYLEGTTIYPHPPQKQYYEAKTVIRKLVEKFSVNIVAIGNGTASRETEQMVAELITEIKDTFSLHYIIVNEAGASVYSASDVARREFPELEASMRGNISIARRLLDPLAELVKIDPKSIGVGLYQHDVNQKKLGNALRDVVESCVNLVGVDINTASASLLKHISGLTSRTAENIVAHRNENGAFKNREQIKTVDGIGDIAFQQSAGFLRINKGENPLDSTSIHPESYTATEKLLDKFNISDFYRDGKMVRSKIPPQELPRVAEEIGVGVPTLQDILKDLEKPGRDPRAELPKPILKSDVLQMEDLKTGMILQGTVRNVVDFGAFVDIGVKQDGLVHVSEMSNKYVKDPHKFVAVGDVITVKIKSVDLERKRIALSMNVD